MPSLPEISKIVVPGLNGQAGGIYTLKDATARQLLSGGINYNIVWDGATTPVVADIPNTVSVIYNETVYTGTLSPSSALPMTFYLVKNSDGGGNDNFSEYVVVTKNGTSYWEKIGETGQSMSNLGALAYMDSIELDKGLGVDVIGANATLLAADSSVTFGTHTTDSVLGAETTFSFTNPSYGATLAKGNISISRTTDVAITPSTASAVIGIKSDSSTVKTSVLKSDTPFTRRKIKTTSIVGLSGETVSQTVTVTPTTHKLATSSFTHTTVGSADPMTYISASSSKLATTSVRGVTGSTTNASAISAVDTSKLSTGTFYQVSEITTNNSGAGEWKDTTANLDFHMYASGTDGTSGVFADADSETLVISFKTMPSLKLAASATTFATGSVASDAAGATVVTGVTHGPVTVPVMDTESTTVATGSLAQNGSGDTVVTSVTKSADIPIATTGSSIVYATGAVNSTAQADNNESHGGEVVTGITSASVTIPETAREAVEVLIPDTTTATNNVNDVNVITEVTTSGHTVDAYTAIGLETDSFVTGISSITQPVMSASVTAEDNGSVVTGVTISKTADGSVTVGSDDLVDAITGLGSATAAAQTISWNSKDPQKVVKYSDLKIKTESYPSKRYLNFVAPSGGTVTLTKNGSPVEVELEYSYDAVNWTLWAPDSTTGERTVTLAANERFYIRNKSEVSTGFSRLNNGALGVDYYHFDVPDNTEVNGILESLLCSTPEFGKVTSGAFQSLFANEKIKGRPIIVSKTIAAGALYRAFYYNLTGNSPLDCVEIRGTTKTGQNNTTNWLKGCAASGTVYCRQELSLTTSSDSGIPTGWTAVYIDVDGNVVE